MYCESKPPNVNLSSNSSTLKPQLPTRRDVACNVSTTCSIFDYNLFLRLPSVRPLGLVPWHTRSPQPLCVSASLRATLFLHSSVCNCPPVETLHATSPQPAASLPATAFCAQLPIAPLRAVLLPKKTDALTSRFRSITPISHCINPKFQGVNPKYRPFISDTGAFSQNGNAVIQHLNASSQ
jgi:hypothetical protein